MCQGCLDAVLKHYSHLSDADKGHLLMNATCFPFGSPEQVEKQLAELRANGCYTLDEAVAFAETKMDEALAEHMKAREGVDGHSNEEIEFQRYERGGNP